MQRHLLTCYSFGVADDVGVATPRRAPYRGLDHFGLWAPELYATCAVLKA